MMRRPKITKSQPLLVSSWPPRFLCCDRPERKATPQVPRTKPPRTSTPPLSRGQHHRVTPCCPTPGGRIRCSNAPAVYAQEFGQAPNACKSSRMLKVASLAKLASKGVHIWLRGGNLRGIIYFFGSPKARADVMSDV